MVRGLRRWQAPQNPALGDRPGANLPRRTPGRVVGSTACARGGSGRGRRTLARARRRLTPAEYSGSRWTVAVALRRLVMVGWWARTWAQSIAAMRRAA